MGAELGERKKQESTKEVKKIAEKLLSHPDALVTLAPKSIIVSAEKMSHKHRILRKFQMQVW
jgi:hypothetical protein